MPYFKKTSLLILLRSLTTMLFFVFLNRKITQGFLRFSKYFRGSLILVLFFFVLSFSFLVFTSFAKADYYAMGAMQSDNILSGKYVTSISEFLLVADVPASTTVSVSFSQDGNIFYNASSTKGGWTDAITGTTTIDLSGLSWTGALFYYKLRLTSSDASTTPVVSEIRVNYNGSDVYTASGYYSQGTLVSTNILSGKYVTSISEFLLVADVPASTTVSVSFSQDGNIFYNSSSTKGGWTDAITGTTTIDLSGLSWTGALFYYKLRLTSSDASTTPVVSEIRVNYNGSDVYTSSGYYSQGTLVSTDLLASTTDVLNGREHFAYNMTYLPPGANVKVQFSQDGVNWYSSDGTAWAYDTLSLGNNIYLENSLDLFKLGWKDATSFYYKLKYQLGADNSTSPVIKSAGIILLAASFGGTGTKSAGPVAYWKFDKGYGATVYDWSGNGNDGTASSSNSGTNTNVSQMWDLDGKYNKAMEFDGTDDYVDVSVVLDSINTGDLSISLWFNPTATFSSPTTSSARLFSFADAASTNDASLSLDNTTGKMRFVMFDSVGGERVTYSSRDVWIEGTWYHALATYSSILGRKLYIDGVLEGVNENTSRGATMATNASIGNRGYLSNWNFYGLIDEVKIFNYALSDDEIKIEYNRTATQMGVKNVDSSGVASDSASREYCVPGDTATCSSPVLELKLDEKQGTTAFDTSGNGGNGTFTGTTTPSWTRGKTGSALDFIANGVDYDYLSVSDSTILTNIFTTGASVSFWINPRSDGFTNGAIVAKRRWLITLTGQSAGKAKLYFEITGNTDKGKWTTTNTVINLNSWNFVSLTYTYASSAVQPVVMVNGKKALLSLATTPLGAYTSDSGENIFVGAEDGAGLASFDGLIDNVKIFNYIRTPAQSAWDYNRGKSNAYYRFDECEGSTIHDWSENNNNGTTTIGVTGTQTALGNCTTASTTTAWYNGRSGRINSALNFDGTDDYISVGDIGMNINSISFWSKQSNANNYFIDLDGGTNTITLSSSELSTTGISAPAYYIDGIEDRSIPDNSWHYITIVTDTSINVSNLVIGKIGANYYNGLLDEIKLYNYALTEEQIKLDYNNGTVKFGG